MPCMFPEVFTPQIIVDGKVQFVGNRANVALAEIAKRAGRASATVAIRNATADGGILTAQINAQNVPVDAGKGPFDVIVAVTESGLQSSPVTGENRGASLSHAGVLRSLTRLGKASSAGFVGDFRMKLEKPWKRDSLRVVAFVQDRKTLAVWGVAQAPLN